MSFVNKYLVTNDTIGLCTPTNVLQLFLQQTTYIYLFTSQFSTHIYPKIRSHISNALILSGLKIWYLAYLVIHILPILCDSTLVGQIIQSQNMKKSHLQYACLRIFAKLKTYQKDNAPRFSHCTLIAPSSKYILTYSGKQWR